MDPAPQRLRPSWPLLVATVIVLAACEIGMAGCWAGLAGVLEHFDKDAFKITFSLVHLGLITLAFGAIACGQYQATFQRNTMAACLISGLWVTSLLLVTLGFVAVTVLRVVDKKLEFQTEWFVGLGICLLAGFIAATNFAWARRLERAGVEASPESRQLSMAGVFVLMTLLALQFGIAGFLLRLSAR